MILLQFLHFFCLLVYAYLAGYILFKDPKSLLNITCAVLISTFSIWNFVDVFSPINYITEDAALLFQNISSVGWISFASAALCFSLVFSKKEKLLKSKIFIFIILILPLFFIYKQWTNCIIMCPVRQVYGWSYTYANNIWTYLFYIYYFSFTLLSIYFIYRYWKKTNNLLEKKLAIIIIATISISLIGGTVFDVVFPELGIYSIPPLANIFILFFAAGLVYAIVKYKFLIITPAIAAENIISTMGELLVLADSKGKILNINNAVSEILKYEKKELTGKPVEMLFGQDHIINSLLERIAQGEIIKNYEVCFLTKDKTNVPVILSSSSLKDKEGNVRGIVFIARDITDNKNVGEALRKSEELLRTVLSNAPITMFATDSNGIFTLSEGKQLELVNLKPGENVGLSAIDLYDSFPFVEITGKVTKGSDVIRRVLKGETINAYSELHGISFENHMVPIRAVDGKVNGLLGVAIDITDRKIADKEKQTLAEMLNLSPAGVIIHDFDGNFIYFNETTLKLHRYTREEFSGLNIEKLNLPDSLPKVQDLLNLIKENGEIDFETSHLRKDGTTFPVLVFAKVVDWKKTKVILSTNTDITEQKQFEKTIFQSKKDWEDSFDSITDMITIHDKDYNIVQANKIAIELLKFPYKEKHQKLKCYSYYHGTSSPPEGCQSCYCFQKGLPGTFELFEPYLNRYLEIRAIPRFDSNNQNVGMIHIVRDISERKKTEKELVKAKEKAEESDRLKSAFLANMSHEIRTPMNGILGFAELLAEPNLAGDKQKEYIQIIENSGKRMLNIINDIVDISKIESGQMIIGISDTNINEQIEQLYDFFKLESEQKGIHLSFKNSLPSNESVLKTDKQKVSAILTNLIKNALKFTHKGLIEFGYLKKGQFLEFFVRDTGAGIRQEQKKIIFERFRQGSESLTRNYDGAGLGLSISKAYVELLGGKIWVESENLPIGPAGEQEGGSTFYFTLPYNNAPNILNTNDKDFLDLENCNEKLKIRNLKILIAEDDETSEKLIKIVVDKFCKEILIARTGLEAINACRNNNDLDLILMDIYMPELNGYEATMQIRKFNKEVMIIAQTAYALSGEKEKALVAGCNDYVSKPINHDYLKEIINKHFVKDY